MKTYKINKEVLYSNEDITRVNIHDIKKLKKLALKNRTKKIRLCTHKNVKEQLQEMLIVHPKDYYVWPHKHVNKSESFHIIEGEVDIVLFNNYGKVLNFISMGAANTGKNFYYRLPQFKYHTLLIRSKVLVFHEITKGPFLKKDTIWASWAPHEKNRREVKQYLEKLKKEINIIKNAKKK
tara:strand:+ start:13027 stop:13566 length:540 start_codon:yes stop_codon:yes gene_type:complete